MYFIYLKKLLRRERMIIQCLQLTEALENPQKTFLRIFHASARCKHRIIPVPAAVLVQTELLCQLADALGARQVHLVTEHPVI